MFFVVYEKDTGIIKQTITAPFFIDELFNLTEAEAVVEIPRQAKDIIEYIKDGVLTLKPDSLKEKIPIAEAQASVWDNIKDKRSLELSKGVLITSVDKVFQTDNNNIIQYSNIAGMIALNNYIPVEWKTSDNTYILLTIDLFKELQQTININTQRLFKVAEDHKEAMLLSENPKEYDYLTNW